MNFLLLLLILVPLFDCFIESLLPQEKLQNLVKKIFMISSTVILCVISQKINSAPVLSFSSLEPHIFLQLSIDQNNFPLLFLLNFLWIIFDFYSTRFFAISNEKEITQFKLFFASSISFINFIIMAKNPVSLLFAYNCLLFTIYLLITKFFFKNLNFKTRAFNFLIFCEAFFLLFAIILTAQYTNQLQFNKDGILNDINSSQIYILFIFYFAAILPTIISLSHLLYHQNCINDSLLSYVFLPLFYGFAKLFILIKIITEIFGIGGFNFVIEKINFEIISAIFLLALIISLFFLLFSKNFKAIFFHLFFSQLIVASFSIIIYAIYNEAMIYKVILNFILASTLTFLTFSNLILYLKKAQNKGVTSLFYNMKITIILLLFGFLNFVGLSPSLALAEKYSLLKIAFNNHLFFAKIFFIVNSLCLFLLMIKLFSAFFLKSDEQKSEEDKKLSEKIDNASSLMLSSLVVGSAILILPIISFFF